MPLAQRFLEGRMQVGGARVGTILQVLGEQVFVFLDDLVDQRAVRGGHRGEIGIAAVVYLVWALVRPERF